MTADDGTAPGAMWQLGDDDVTIARRLLEIASHPPRFVKGLDPTGPPKDWAHQIVTQVDDMKVDNTSPLLMAQTHAILAVAAELAEANRIARGSNPGEASTPLAAFKHIHKGGGTGCGVGGLLTAYWPAVTCPACLQMKPIKEVTDAD